MHELDKPRSSRICIRDVLIGFCLVVLTLAIYWQVVGFEFTNFDDDQYVENNPAVRYGLSGQTVRWAFTTRACGNWHPLTWVSLMADTGMAGVGAYTLDNDLGKKSSGYYHLTNALLHTANVVLLFVVLTRLTPLSSLLGKGGKRGVWRGAFIAALFAVHPLHVESVAWVSERKDVLSTLFWLLTMLAYERYARAQARHSEHREESPDRAHWWVIGFFILGLLSKPMLVSLPVVLLLLDLWPLDRFQVSGFRGFRAFAIEKVPLFALAAASCLVTVWAQRSGGAVADVVSYPIGVRLANAAVAYFAYLVKMVWPSDLAFLYLHPGTSLPVWLVALSSAGLAVVTALAIRAARTRPYLTVGWLWYLITLLPVIGLVQVGKQAMADRYTYVPLIGIFIIVAWGVPDLIGEGRRKTIAMGVVACAVVIALAVAACPVVGMWRNNVTLYARALEVDPTNSLAYMNFGNHLLAEGDADGAVDNLRKALKYHPEFADARYNLAGALYQQGNANAAITEYKKVLREYPKFAEAHNNLGSIHATQGKMDLAIAEFRAALRADPSSQSARENLDKALGQSGGM